jgi:hypothetical protein
MLLLLRRRRVSSIRSSDMWVMVRWKSTRVAIMHLNKAQRGWLRGLVKANLGTSRRCVCALVVDAHGDDDTDDDDEDHDAHGDTNAYPKRR